MNEGTRMTAPRGRPMTKDNALANLREAQAEVERRELELSAAITTRDEALARARQSKLIWSELCSATRLSEPTVRGIVRRVLGRTS